MKVMKSLNEVVDTSLLEKFSFIYNDDDKKPNIVYIHGYAANRFSNLSFEERNKKFNYYTFNLPGSWETYKQFSRNDLKIKLHVKLVVKFLIEQNLRNVILIGHSLGAGIAAMVFKELKKDKRIIKLVLIAPLNITSIPKIITKFNFFFPTKFNGLLRLQKIAFKNPNMVVPKLDAKYNFTNKYWSFINMNNKYIRGVQWELMKPSLFMQIEKGYKSIDVPTLLIVGDSDKLVDHNNTIYHFKNTIEDLEYHKFKDAGHGLLVENDKVYYRTIMDFIKK
ncbi:MAG: alpha/beta fold hydrolase [Mycoplasmoidaceae bacterium]